MKWLWHVCYLLACFIVIATFGLAIKSELAFYVGSELCVWLAEKSWPVLLSSLSPTLASCIDWDAVRLHDSKGEILK